MKYNENGTTAEVYSTGSAFYVLPRTRTRFGERGFFYSGPAAWNTLPSDLHDITDTGTFTKRLKSVFFDSAYHSPLTTVRQHQLLFQIVYSRNLAEYRQTHKEVIWLCVASHAYWVKYLYFTCV